MQFIIKLAVILVFFIGAVYSSDFITGSSEKVKYYFHADDSAYVKSLSKRIETELVDLEQIFNHKTRNTIKIYFPASETEFDKITGGKLPEWSGAVAISENRVIIIKPQLFSDKNDEFITIKHELVHIVIADKYLENNLPLWLNEGLATYLSNNVTALNEVHKISNAIAANAIFDLRKINEMMLLNTASANLAYLEAKIAVEFMIQQIGINNLPVFLDDLNKSKNADKVFRDYLGYDLIDFEYYWYNYMKEKYQGIFAFNFDNIIWYALIIIVFIAFIVVKMRNYRKKKSWVEEELINNMEE